MSLARGRGVTLWRQIAQEIEAEIRAHRYKPGEQLPTEWELTQRFGVNRHTVRRAMAALAEDGVLRAEQGRGTFVQEGILDYPIGRRTRFQETIRRQHRGGSGRLLEAGELAADRRLARMLSIDEGAPLICLDLMREVDGQPISLSTHYFPASRFAGIADAFRQSLSITEALKSCGIADYLRRQTRITARLPEPSEIRLLGMSRARPVLVTEGVNVDLQHIPIEYGIARFAADRVHLVVELATEDDAGDD